MTSKAEMKIYEFFGIKVFQKIVLKLEAVIHYRDKGKNINYYIPSKDISALDAFVKYLFYNGSIHARNLVMFVGYLLLKALFNFGMKPYDYIICLFAVKDLYCVLLQRYNFLRIRRCRELMRLRQVRRTEAAIQKKQRLFQEKYDNIFVSTDLAVIRRIKASIENQEAVILSDADILTLNRLLSVSCEDTETINALGE